MSRSTRGAPETIKGSWSEAEDNQLRDLYGKYGQNWAQLALELGSRNAKQCRERWVQNLAPCLERGPITEEEGAFIQNLVSQIGQKWAEISRRLVEAGVSNRSDNAIKNWFNGNKNRQRRQAARQNRQASMSLRVRGRTGPPAPLNLDRQHQLPLPLPHSSQTSPTTPVHGEYHGYPAHHHHQSHHYQHQHQPAPAHASPYSYDRRPSSSHQLPRIHHALSHEQQQQQYSAPHHHQQPYQHYSQQPRYNDRRPSVNTTMGSPEHHYVPSLVSDTGSPPSARESPMHMPASPNTAVPPMNIILPPLPPIGDKETAAHSLQDLRYRRASSSMARSWSNRSDEQSHYQSLPPPAPVAVRPCSSDRAPASRPMALNNLLN